jgi:hypothetical protein
LEEEKLAGVGEKKRGSLVMSGAVTREPAVLCNQMTTFFFSLRKKPL